MLVYQMTEEEYIIRLKKRINILESVLEGDGQDPEHYYKHSYKEYLENMPLGTFHEI